jgi:hypothetical protein
MPPPNHTSTLTLIYSPPTKRIIFALGVAHSHALLPEDLFIRFIHFLTEDLALLDFGDTLLSSDYLRIYILFRDLRRWVDGPSGPSWEMIREAEKAAPEKTWRAPALHARWKYDIRPGGKRGPVRFRRTDWEWREMGDEYDDYWVEDVSDQV